MAHAGVSKQEKRRGRRERGKGECEKSREGREEWGARDEEGGGTGGVP